MTMAQNKFVKGTVTEYPFLNNKPIINIGHADGMYRSP